MRPLEEFPSKCLKRRSGRERFLCAFALPLLWATTLMVSVFAAQAGATFTSLYSFTGGDDGYGPNGLVQGSDGFLYGTAFNGGTNSDGTVFKISTSGALTSLYSFSGANDGANPEGVLVQGSDGFFYGTTQAGGKPVFPAPAGTVFKIGSNGTLTTLYSFTVDFPGGNDGSYPMAGLVQNSSDGNFYGTTFEGGTYGFSGNGTNGFGTVFRISPSGTLTNLYSFSGGADGANPAGGLSQGSDGNFYGTTQAGGLNNSGTVFKLDPTVTTPGEGLTNLYSFTGGSDGGGPVGSLLQGRDGYFYGTTANGGASGFGTVFKISTNGALTNLYSFTGLDDGANPLAGLVQGSDGNFYGTTQSGGTNGGEGTVFRISPKGAFASLYSFSGGKDGSNPQAALVQAEDGSFYGTTVNGGLGGAGTIFRLAVVLGPPQLLITSSGGNVVLKWPANPAGFKLQSTTNLGSSAAWTTNSVAPVVINGQNTVTTPISGTQQFFRLGQ
jgi:uncharacterized repeat protein (TIGR03803 family)